MTSQPREIANHEINATTQRFFFGFQFGKVALFTPHKNPTAKVETNIKHYKHHSISRAYRGETFYWGLVPQSDDFLLFQLTPPVALSSIKFVSGNVEHPSDR